jgi:hypothetical protein
MKTICQEHTKRLRAKPQPAAPAGGENTYDPENLEDMRRTFPEDAEAACGIPIEPNLDTRRLDRALDRIKAELEDGDSREDEDQ